jgi:phage gp46-like protein
MSVVDIQQGDVLLQQTLSDGEITLANGLITMTGGLETAAYLSLFGGNKADAGGDDTAQAWWGNLLDSPGPRRQRSETQHIIDGLPATTANLIRVQTAAERDLAWLVPEGLASRITVAVSMPAVRRVQIDITIQTAAGSETLRFVENWGAQ